TSAAVLRATWCIVLSRGALTEHWKAVRLSSWPADPKLMVYRESSCLNKRDSTLTKQHKSKSCLWCVGVTVMVFL
ncbi:hypothetical protein COO60DRAFT_1525226, partial [Scenedesmus sp. NREL 46B-D3]